MNHWLLKSEPDSFSIDDLGQASKQTTSWDGVRNFQARNMLRDSMKKGDLAFFYHSSCAVPGIAGSAISSTTLGFAQDWNLRLNSLATESGVQHFYEPLAAQVGTGHLQHR